MHKYINWYFIHIAYGPSRKWFRIGTPGPCVVLTTNKPTLRGSLRLGRWYLSFIFNAI